MQTWTKSCPRDMVHHIGLPLFLLLFFTLLIRVQGYGIWNMLFRVSRIQTGPTTSSPFWLSGKSHQGVQEFYLSFSTFILPFTCAIPDILSTIAVPILYT